jgi:hypothetical protein
MIPQIFQNGFQLGFVLGVLVILHTTLASGSAIGKTQNATDIIFGNATNPDFLLVMGNITTDPAITYLSLGGKGYVEFCPSNRCTIEFGSNTKFDPPNPSTRSIGYDIGFRLVDNKTHQDLGPKEKDFQEEFKSGMYGCPVYNIEEDNNQEVYYCQGGTHSIERQFDLERWYYDSAGIYDAKAGTFIVIGNYSHSETFFIG